MFDQLSDIYAFFLLPASSASTAAGCCRGRCRKCEWGNLKWCTKSVINDLLELNSWNFCGWFSSSLRILLWCLQCLIFAKNITISFRGCNLCSVLPPLFLSHPPPRVSFSPRPTCTRPQQDHCTRMWAWPLVLTGPCQIVRYVHAWKWVAWNLRWWLWQRPVLCRHAEHPQLFCSIYHWQYSSSGIQAIGRPGIPFIVHATAACFKLIKAGPPWFEF